MALYNPKRRSVIAGAFIFLVCLGVATTPALLGPPTLFQFEDYMNQPFLAEYQKQYGEKPNIAIYADEDEAFAKMRAGFKPNGPLHIRVSALA